MPRLTTPHARRHYSRLVRRGWTLTVYPGEGRCPTSYSLDAPDTGRPLEARGGTLAAAIAVALGRDGSASHDWDVATASGPGRARLPDPRHHAEWLRQRAAGNAAKRAAGEPTYTMRRGWSVPPDSTPW